MKKSVFARASGFTLIELSIVMVISGLVMAVGFNTYHAYLQDRNAHDANDRQKVIDTSISSYINKRGRLPCPADPTLPLTDNNAGKELPDIPPGGGLCSQLQLQADGVCWHYDGTVSTTAGRGVCKTSGRDTILDIDANGDPVLVGGVPYVTIKEGIALNEGAVLTPGNDATLPEPPPKECVATTDITQIVGIRQLPVPPPPGTPPLITDPIPKGTTTYCDYNSDGVLDAGVTFGAVTANFEDTSLKTILDPWGYQMTYAVTGALTNKQTAHDSYGAINIQTENGVDLVKPAGSGHYVLVSHGDNHMGAYSPQGLVPYPCTTGGKSVDEKNCTITAPATYVEGIRSVNTTTAAGKLAYNDDVVSHRVVQISSLWSFVDGTADIYNLNIGNVGVGQLSPTQKLDIKGVLRATTATAEKLCDKSGSNCWNPDTMAGDPNVKDKDGVTPLGTTCPAVPAIVAGHVRVAIGFVNGKVVCSGDPADPAHPDPVKIVPVLGGAPCVPPLFMAGIKTDGTYDCQTLPLPP